MEIIAVAIIIGIVWFVWKFSRPKQRAATPASSGSNTFHLDGDGSFSVEVVGESKYQGALDAIVGGKTNAGHEFECVAHVKREPHNRYDKNAIVVMIDGKTVGYIPKQTARNMARLMDGKGITSASVDAMIVGGWTRRSGDGHYGVMLDIS